MMRVLVRSRYGNIVLAIIGVAYAVASLSVLVWLVVDVWQASTTFDRLIQFALVGSAACGVWFLANAMQNLGIRSGNRHGVVSKAASIQR